VISNAKWYCLYHCNIHYKDVVKHSNVGQKFSCVVGIVHICHYSDVASLALASAFWPRLTSMRNKLPPTTVMLPNLVVLGQTVEALLTRSAWKFLTLMSRLSRLLKVIGTDTDRSVAMTSYQRFIATMSLSRTFSEINGDFSRKSQIFTLPHISILIFWSRYPCVMWVWYTRV